MKKLVQFREKKEGYAREVADCAIVHIATGMKFREEELAIPEELKGEVEKRAQEFIRDKARSKPIGFYTWTENLKKIFTSDRFYQKKAQNE